MTETDRPTIFYDGDCPICTRGARRFARLLHTRDFVLQPLQTPGVTERLGLTLDQLLEEMRLRLPDGRVFAGADAFLQISRHFWWAWPFYLLGHSPGMKPILRALYRQFARNRYCISGACQIGEPRTTAVRPTRFLPLLVLPMIALGFINVLTPWLFMWAMAFALFAGCKWLTFCEAHRTGVATTLPRKLAYLFAWPGMDATTFLGTNVLPARPKPEEWIFAAAKTLLGAGLIGFLVTYHGDLVPLLKGWIGMVGIIFLLHFGTFHLLSLVWRRVGINAPPIMRSPLRAVSLAEFWGRRWNTAFHELVFRFTFRPLRRKAGPTTAMLLVFLVSGLIHDLVISLPARGGYGLPTLYFLMQGLGVVGERTRLGRRIGLGHGLRGWVFTVMVTVGPVFWLFHPAFIHHVILPMLHAFGAN